MRAGLDDTLLEREAELDAIESALDAVEGGTGQLVVLEASAGAGKTRLLEFTQHRAQERGFVVLHARAAELEQEFPFGVVLQLFEPRLRSADDDERARLLSGAAAFASSLFELGGNRPARIGRLPEGDAPYATLHGGDRPRPGAGPNDGGPSGRGDRPARAPHLRARRRSRELARRLEAELLAAARLSIHTRPLVSERLESLRERAEERGPAERALLANLAYEAVIQGEPAQRGAELAARALGAGALLADEGSESPTYYYAAWALALCDRLTEATDALDAAIADARAHGSGLGFGLASCFRSNVCYRRGLVADAEADARNTLAVASHDGLEASLPLAIAFLMDALIERGELGEAEETLERSGLAAEFPDLIAFNPLLGVMLGTFPVRALPACRMIGLDRRSRRRPPDA